MLGKKAASNKRNAPVIEDAVEIHNVEDSINTLKIALNHYKNTFENETFGKCGGNLLKYFKDAITVDNGADDILLDFVTEFMIKTANCISRNETDNKYTYIVPEIFFCLSLVEYLYYEAPYDEQNMFMIVELIDAAVPEDSYDSDLDRLYKMLEEKNPNHIALIHYRDFKYLAGKKLKDILLCFRKRFYPLFSTNDDIRQVTNGNATLVWNNLKENFEIESCEDERMIEYLSKYLVDLRHITQNDKEKYTIRKLINVIKTEESSTTRDLLLKHLSFFEGFTYANDEFGAIDSLAISNTNTSNDSRVASQIDESDSKQSLDSEEIDIVELFDDDGASMTFELLSKITISGSTYVLITPFDEREATGEKIVESNSPADVYIMKEVIDVDGNTLLEPLDDKALVEKVFGIFRENSSGKYKFS